MSIDTQAIDKNTRKLRSLVKESSQLLSGKQVHRLRTRTRRIEAILDALQLNKKRNERRLLRGLAALRKKAGKVRDMDVLTEALSKINLNGDKQSLVPVIEFLGQERQRRAKKLRQALAKNGSEIRRRLKRTASRLVKLVEGDAHGRVEAINAKRQKKAASQKHEMTHEMTPAARAKIAAAIVRMSDELAAPPSLNKSNLHEYRKSVKKLRYVLQAAEEHANAQLIAALGKCKDAIGAWHDWDALVNIANEVAEDDDSVRQAVKKLAAIRQQKFDAALALTNAMRAKYVQFEPSAQHRRASHRAAPRRSSSPRRSVPGATATKPASAEKAEHHDTRNGHRQHDAALHLAASVAAPPHT